MSLDFSLDSRPHAHTILVTHTPQWHTHALLTRPTAMHAPQCMRLNAPSSSPQAADAFREAIDFEGIDRLLQAFSMVVAQYPQARLVLKGVDSIYRSKDRLTGVMRSLTPDAAAAVEARKTYIGGNYKLVDMTRLYQCADAFVAPYVSEAFCSPALEAAACGLPSICTQGGPTEEFTADEFSLRIGARWDAQARILVPDVNHLAQNMAFVLTNTAWKERAKIVAADFVSRRFSWIQATYHLLRTVGL